MGLLALPFHLLLMVYDKTKITNHACAGQGLCSGLRALLEANLVFIERNRENSLLSIKYSLAMNIILSYIYPLSGN